MENVQVEKVQAEKKNNKIMTMSGEVELSQDIVKKYLVNGDGKVTDQEVLMFIGMCKANKLNPFNKDAYLIKYGSQPATMAISKDVFFKRAIDNPMYNGMESGLCIEKDDTIEKRVGCAYIPKKEKIIGAWCKVYRKDWEYPVYQEVNFCEYAGYKKTGELNANWANKPAVMITKVAEATALRKAFTDILENMYIAEEVEQPKPVYEKVAEVIPDILEETETNE